jgi:hypothetical protein
LNKSIKRKKRIKKERQVVEEDYNKRGMVLTTGFEPVTSSLPWNCSTVGAMQAKRINI